ncbi:hypothetical protein GMSM_08820 [Geomonas sp. Red276]
MLPKVTFIIPCYNEEPYLGRCLAAIGSLYADPAAIEVIVVDNCSTDGSREVAASHGGRVLLNDRRGAAASRNLGAREARGALLAFVDADCLLPPGWLTALAGHLENRGGAAAAAPALPAAGERTWVERAWSAVFRPLHAAGDSPAPASYLPSADLLVVRSYFEEIGGFDETLLSCEDYHLSQRLRNYGLLLLDRNHPVVHLRESRTVAELFHRERARGRFSLRCFAKDGFPLREAPSLAVPALTLLAAAAFSLSALLGRPGATLAGAFALSALPLVYLVKSGERPEGLGSLLQQYAVAATYLLARSSALAGELMELTLPNRR